MSGFQAKWQWLLVVCLATNLLSADPAADTKYRFQDYFDCTKGVAEISPRRWFWFTAFQEHQETLAVVASRKIFFLSPDAISILPMDRIKQVDLQPVVGDSTIPGKDLYFKLSLEWLSQTLRLKRWEYPLVPNPLPERSSRAMASSGDNFNWGVTFSVHFEEAPNEREVQDVQTDSVKEGESLPTINNHIIKTLTLYPSGLNTEELAENAKTLERIKPACLRLGSKQVAAAVLQYEGYLAKRKEEIKDELARKRQKSILEP